MWNCEWTVIFYKLVLVLAGVWILYPGLGQASTPYVKFNWTRSNARFVPNVGAKLSIAVGTNLDVACPTNTTPSEYYIVYWVSEQGFRECFKPENASQLFVICNKPHDSDPLEFTIDIVTFSGTPGGKDFEVGKNYYLATFSSGTENGIGNLIGGACQQHSMKLNLTILSFSPPTTPGPSTNKSTTTKRTGTPTLTPHTKPSSGPPSTESTTIETTPRRTTPIPHTTDIPIFTEIPVITVPDSDGNGNIGVIDISSGTYICPASWLLVLCLCFSIVHILFYNGNDAHR